MENYTNYNEHLFNEQNLLNQPSTPLDFNLFQIEGLLGLESSETNKNSLELLGSLETQGQANKKRRVTKKACDYCRTKHLKCNGEYPCDRCLNAMTECKYEHIVVRRAPYSKSKELEVMVKELSSQMEELRTRNTQLEELLSSYSANTATQSATISPASNSDSSSISDEQIEQIVSSDDNTLSSYLQTINFSLSPTVFSTVDIYLERYQKIFVPIVGIDTLSFDRAAFLNGTLQPKYSALTNIMLSFGAKSCGNTDHSIDFLSQAKRLMQDLYISIDPIVAIAHGILSRPLLGSNQKEEAIVHGALAVSKGKALLRKDNAGDRSLAYTAICIGIMTDMMASRELSEKTIARVGKYVEYLPLHQQSIMKCIMNYVKAISYVGTADVAIPLSLLDTAMIHIPKGSKHFTSAFMAIINGLRGALYAWSGNRDMGLAYCEQAMQFVPKTPKPGLFMIFAVLSICAQVYIKIDDKEGLNRCITHLQGYTTLTDKAAAVIEYILDPSTRPYHDSTQHHWFALGFMILGEPLAK